MLSVLFVCLGNVCRSPMAEALLRHKLMLAGLSDRVSVDSAGLGVWHVGDPPHRGTRKVLDAAGVSYAGQVARLLLPSDLTTFDYILTMDHANMDAVQQLLQENPTESSTCIRSVMSFVSGSMEDVVPDPYYDGRYTYVHSLLDNACNALLEELQEHCTQP